MRLFAALAILLLVPSCKGSDSEDASPVVIIPPETFPTFAAGVNQGNATSVDLTEVSGIAASRQNAGVLWVHNDSGDSERFFAMDTAGVHLGIYTITGAGSIDWEDMAVGPGPVAGQQYLYVGDIGTNGGARAVVTIYRVAEPVVSSAQAPVNVSVGGWESLPVSYPGGGNAPNAETLMVDPVNGDIYIVTKDPAGTSGVYRYPAPQTPGITATLTLVATLQFGTAPLVGSVLTTGGDISPLGNWIVIRSYSAAYLWLRQGGTNLWDAFAAVPMSLPVFAGPQDEAIGVAADGQGYYTMSEGVSQGVYFYARTD